MTKIIGSDQLLGLISQNLAKVRRRDRLISTGSLKQKSQKKQVDQSLAGVVRVGGTVDSEISEIVAYRLSEISLEDPLRSTKAFRIFLEAILTNEFGVDFANDPGFSSLIEQIQETMGKDVALAGLIDRAMLDLLRHW